MYCICLYARIKFIIYDAGMDMLSIYIHNYTHVPAYGQWYIESRICS